MIPRIVRDGAEIYRGKLPATEASERLTRLYRPYHAALPALVEQTLTILRRRGGDRLPLDAIGAAVPDVVLGDRYGIASAAALMTQHAQQAFELRAFTVARNVPYAGGFTTQLYGRPARGVHALQIEINRALYLDEERIVPRPALRRCARSASGEALAPSGGHWQRCRAPHAGRWRRIVP